MNYGEYIGYVPQKGSAFSGNIASNLRYGSPNARDETSVTPRMWLRRRNLFADAGRDETDISQRHECLRWAKTTSFDCTRIDEKRRLSIFLTTVFLRWTLRRMPLCVML